MQFFHGFLEQFSVLGFHDAGNLGAQQLHVVFFQDAFFIQLNGQVQAHLAAQGGQQGIRAFLGNNAFQKFHIQGFYINPVGNVYVGHNGGRVAVDQHHFQPFFFQGPASLGPCIVKLCSLADNDRTGTDYHDFLDIFFFWHINALPSF